jgi:hypothetical protein
VDISAREKGAQDACHADVHTGVHTVAGASAFVALRASVVELLSNRERPALPVDLIALLRRLLAEGLGA